MTRAKTDTASSGFGQRLREMREAAGLSQAEVADRIGSTTNTVSRIEIGQHEPGWPLALAIADALGREIQEFRATPVKPARRKRGRPPKASG